MKLLLTITEQDVTPGVAANTFPVREREAARAVLIDASGGVHLIYVSKHGYHKLPGGGIETGEDVQQALQRELLEEVGCQADIAAELGMIVECRTYPDSQLKQTSYCYLAHQKGGQVASALEADELAEGMVAVRATSIDEAIELLSNDKPDNVEGAYILRRDLCFLRAAQAMQ